MTENRQPTGISVGGQFATTPRPEAQLTLTVTVPTPEPVTPPEGHPQALISNLNLADETGQVCGILTINGTELGFEAFAWEGDKPLIEDPTNEDWAPDPDMTAIIGEDGDPAAYQQYMEAVIARAASAFHKLSSQALESAADQLAAAINGQ